MSRAKAGANPALPFFLQNGPSRFFQCDSGTVNKLNLYCAETRCVCELNSLPETAVASSAGFHDKMS